MARRGAAHGAARRMARRGAWRGAWRGCGHVSRSHLRHHRDEACRLLARVRAADGARLARPTGREQAFVARPAEKHAGREAARGLEQVVVGVGASAHAAQAATRRAAAAQAEARAAAATSIRKLHAAAATAGGAHAQEGEAKQPLRRAGGG